MSQSVNPTSDSLAAIEAAALQLLHAVRSAGDNRFSIGQSSPVGTPATTVAELFNEFLLSKARAGRSDNYTGLLLKELRSFCTGREQRPAASITAREIEDWLYKNDWASRTRKGRLMTLRNVFQWAVLRGELAANVANGIDMPQDDSAEEPPGIHTPAEVRQVMDTARRLDRDVMRCLALRYFAGLRTSEATAIEETEIKADFIEVTARKAKTRRRRLVPVLPVLRAWLAIGGTLPLAQVNNRLRAVTLAAGVPWPHNAARHSFVTYHLAKFQNAGQTALFAGHTEQMLFNHYREICTPADAEQFFNLFP